jgi:hypothetical protein
MVMRAHAREANTSSRPEAAEAAEARPMGPDDALIMVIFPKASWDAVVQLAGDLGMEPAEALGEALLLLRARADAER